MLSPDAWEEEQFLGLIDELHELAARGFIEVARDVTNDEVRWKVTDAGLEALRECGR